MALFYIILWFSRVATIEKQGVDRGSDFNQDWCSMLPHPDLTTLTLDFD